MKQRDDSQKFLTAEFQPDNESAKAMKDCNKQLVSNQGGVLAAACAGPQHAALVIAASRLCSASDRGDEPTDISLVGSSSNALSDENDDFSTHDACSATCFSGPRHQIKN